MNKTQAQRTAIGLAGVLIALIGVLAWQLASSNDELDLSTVAASNMVPESEAVPTEPKSGHQSAVFAETTVTTSTTTTVTTSTTTTLPPSTTITEPVRQGVDLDHPLLHGYETALGYFIDYGRSDSPKLFEDLHTLNEMTGAIWGMTMLLALDSSYCNNWPISAESTNGSLLSELGLSNWATAIAPVLGIAESDAWLAIDSGIWRDYQYVCE